MQSPFVIDIINQRKKHILESNSFHEKSIVNHFYAHCPCSFQLWTNGEKGIVSRKQLHGLQ